MSEDERTLFRRRQIGFRVPEFQPDPYIDGKDNLLLPLELTGQLDSGGRTGPADMLEELGMAQRMDYYPDRLSTGEQQRIAIARALIH